jgi:NDP-sugar pyrophosphorylase family protein
MNKTINVFILAAGLGERLEPITHEVPKPLLPLLGKPLLQYILEKISMLSINRIGINLFYKKDIIEDWIKKSIFNKTITTFHEETLLGTGGALKNAESFLKDNTFLVHNSDILSDIDLTKLLEQHLSSQNLVTLAVYESPEFNNLIIDEKGFLKGIKDKQGTVSDTKDYLTFTGIAVYEPEFLRFLSVGKSSIVDGWLDALRAGYKIGTFDARGYYWRDIGTPFAYASAVFEILRFDGEKVYIHPSTQGCEHIEMDGYVVIEDKCLLNKGVFLRNCIMLPESLTTPNSRYENCILGRNFRIDFNESEVLGLSDDDAILISTGGSDREYYRVRKDDASAIFVQCTYDDQDFQRHIEYTRFFLRHSIPVPKLIEIESDKMMAIFEDLGDISLYSWLKCPRRQEEIIKVYKEVLDILISIHTVVTEHVTECPALQRRVFDYGHFRWETRYFMERFVKGIKNIKIKDLMALNWELDRLAQRTDSFPKTVIHRDFQSQNIMITKEKTPRIIDYQGARMGPPAYDVASILWDPYYRLEEDVREILLDYYISEMIKRSKEKFDEDTFRESLLPCRLQRHMQALGAYGFLSKEKGKRYFLKFVPEGICLLKEDVSLARAEYPVLYDLVTGL